MRSRLHTERGRIGRSTVAAIMWLSLHGGSIHDRATFSTWANETGAARPDIKTLGLDWLSRHLFDSNGKLRISMSQQTINAMCFASVSHAE